MSIEEFKDNYLQEIQIAIDDVELALDEFEEEDRISAEDINYLVDYSQNVINALDELKALIDDLLFH